MKKKLNTGIPTILQLLLSVSLLLSSSFSLYAADTSRFWKRIGPEGGTIDHFITNKNHPQIVYAFSSQYRNSSGTYFKSINNGKSWVALPKINNSDLRRNSPYLTKGLAVDSDNPNILYAYSDDGLLKSTSNALDWQALGSDLNLNVASFFSLNIPITQTLRALVNTNDVSETVMVASLDGGQHWDSTETNLNLLFPGIEGHRRIIIETSDAKKTDILYGVSYANDGFHPPPRNPPYPQYLYKSTDEGSSWINITAPEKAYQSGFVIDPNNSEKLYATFADSFYGRNKIMLTSNNGGKDWSPLRKLSENLIDFYIPNVYIDPAESNILYANLFITDFKDVDTHNNHIAKSNDYGVTWQIIETSSYIPGEISINAQNNQQLLMATPQGILRSENGGLDWLPSNTGIKSIQGVLTIAESDNSYMYLIDDHDTYYKTSDGGQNWKIFNKKKTVRDCKKFLINPAEHKEIICQRSSKFFIR